YPIHFPESQFLHRSARSRRSRENDPGGRATAHALYRNPRSPQMLEAPELQFAVHIPRATKQSCPGRAGRAPSPCTRTSPCLRSTAQLPFPFAPFLFTASLGEDVCFKRPSSPDAKQIYATATPI